ncbi:MAG: M23 family metallopeptidase [Alphaproteobacteria bacterium]
MPSFGFGATTPPTPEQCNKAKADMTAYAKTMEDYAKQQDIARQNNNQSLLVSIQAKIKALNEANEKNLIAYADCTGNTALNWSLAGDSMKCGDENNIAYYDPFLGKIAHCIIYEATRNMEEVRKIIFEDDFIKTLSYSIVIVFIFLFGYRLSLGLIENPVSEFFTTVFYASFAFATINIDNVEELMKFIRGIGEGIAISASQAYDPTYYASSQDGVLLVVFKKLSTIIMRVFGLVIFSGEGACASGFNLYQLAFSKEFKIITFFIVLFFSFGFGLALALILIMIIWYIIRLTINIFFIYVGTSLLFLLTILLLPLFGPLSIFKKFRKMLNTLTIVIFGNALFFGIYVGVLFFSFNILDKSSKNLCDAWTVINGGKIDKKSILGGKTQNSDQSSSATSSGAYGGGGGLSQAEKQKFLATCNGSPGSGKAGPGCRITDCNPDATKTKGFAVSDRCHPAPFHVFTSGYGWRWGRMHWGIDLAWDKGSPVCANVYGIVNRLVPDYPGSKAGNELEVWDCNGGFTRYLHLNKFLVERGDIVEAGARIADMGTTGRSTGVHLHFECYPTGGGAVNPIGNCITGAVLNNKGGGGGAGSSVASSSSATTTGASTFTLFVPVLTTEGNVEEGGVRLEWSDVFSYFLVFLASLYFVFALLQNMVNLWQSFGFGGKIASIESVGKIITGDNEQIGNKIGEGTRNVVRKMVK